MKTNNSLHSAKKEKNDEFYTQLKDIENECNHYAEHFKNKVILCNCNDVLHKNFTLYFYRNFKTLGLKKLIATGYKVDGEHGKVCSYDGKEWSIEMLSGDGGYSTEECIEFLKESDIIVTNPPFSLFRDYVATLMKYNKKFLIIGNMNAITYKEIFPLIKDDKMWLGVTRNGCGQMYFIINNDMPEAKGQIVIDGQKYQTIGSSAWFTNLDHNKRHEKIVLTKKYNDMEYQHYDNYDAIDVSKVVNIPINYNGVMGVPITFLGKYCPDQFQIIKFRKGDDDKDLSVNGKCPYFRILIKHKRF